MTVDLIFSYYWLLSMCPFNLSALLSMLLSVQAIFVKNFEDIENLEQK